MKKTISVGQKKVNVDVRFERDKKLSLKIVLCRSVLMAKVTLTVQRGELKPALDRVAEWFLVNEASEFTGVVQEVILREYDERRK